jgi:release factor glutamine methyltransferase
MTVREALTQAAAELAAVSDTPRLDADLLMALALGMDRETMLLSKLEDTAPEAFAALLRRRLAHEPVAYITGRRAFWTIELEVGPGVLVPRADSETLIEAALDHFGTDGPRTILDLGTGPGTLLLAALDQWPDASGLGIDASAQALEFAETNAERLGFSRRALFQEGDWANGVQGRFDLILCNPPYIAETATLPPDVAKWEPAKALFAGGDGLDAYRRLAPSFPALIADGGLACVEIGEGQTRAVEEIFANHRLSVSSRKDLGGRTRCLCLTA